MSIYIIYTFSTHYKYFCSFTLLTIQIIQDLLLLHKGPEFFTTGKADSFLISQIFK